MMTKTTTGVLVIGVPVECLTTAVAAVNPRGRGRQGLLRWLVVGRRGLRRSPIDFGMPKRPPRAGLPFGRLR